MIWANFVVYEIFSCSDEADQTTYSKNKSTGDVCGESQHVYSFLFTLNCSFEVVCIDLRPNEMNVFASPSKKWLRQIASVCHVSTVIQSVRIALVTPDQNYWSVLIQS